MNEVKFIDLFAGVGGFHKGLQQAGSFKCVWANEWDKYTSQIYKKRFPKTEFFGGDIRTVDVNRLPDFDLLCGGFPCQAFSIAGKRKGFDDTRGTLFFEIAKIIKAKKPKIVFLENVRGLLSHENGRTFGRIIEILGNMGYWVEWEVLNSKNFGVPQNRERVFIIGHLTEKCQQQVFPIGQSHKINTIQKPNKEFQEQDISNCLRTNYSKAYSNETYIIDKKGRRKMKDIASTLSGGGHSGGNHSQMDLLELTSKQSQGQRVYSTDGIASTIASQAGGLGAKTGLYAIPSANSQGFEVAEEGDGIRISHIGSTTSRSRVGKGKSQALLGGGDMYCVQKQEIRRLTPIECERLQGFPDGWTKGLSDTQRYKCMGNAVTVNVIQAIGERMLEVDLFG